MMRIAELLSGVAPLREGEGGGGGAGGGQGDGGEAGAWSPPEGLPADFVGKDPAETLGKVWGAYSELDRRATGLRTQLAQIPKAPEKPEAYTFKPSEKIAPYFQSDTKSIDFARQAFHKHGIPDTAFQGVIEDIYGPMVDAGMLPAPFNPQKEIDGFAKATGLDRGAVSGALNETMTFAKGLTAQLQGVPADLKPQVDAALLSLTDTAAGNVLLRALSGRLAEVGIRVAGEAPVPAGALNAAELKKLSSDPRIDPANRGHADPNKRFDPELRKRYDQGYQALPAR